MKVLDTSFLIDYGNGEPAAGEYLAAHPDEQYVLPAPVYTEYLLGTVHSDAATSIDEARGELDWCAVVEVTDETAVVAAEIADAIGPEGPELTVVDALVAAVARQFDAAVVTRDSDLTHPDTRSVVDVDAYRE